MKNNTGNRVPTTAAGIDDQSPATLRDKLLAELQAVKTDFRSAIRRNLVAVAVYLPSSALVISAVGYTLKRTTHFIFENRFAVTFIGISIVVATYKLLEHRSNLRRVAQDEERNRLKRLEGIRLNMERFGYEWCRDIMFRVLRQVGTLAGLQIPVSVEMLNAKPEDRVFHLDNVLFYQFLANKADQVGELEVVASRELLQRNLFQLIGTVPTHSASGFPRPSLSVDEVIDLGTYAAINVAVVTPDYDHTRELRAYLGQSTGNPFMGTASDMDFGRENPHSF